MELKMKKYLFILLCSLSSITFSQTEGWENITAPLGSLNSVISTNDNIIILGTSTGIYRSENYCKSWYKSNSGVGNNVVNALNKIGNRIIAGVETGVYISDDKGYNWVKTSHPNVSITSLVVSNNGMIYSKEYYGPQYSSADSGLTWKELSYGSTPSEKEKFSKSWELLCNDESNLFMRFDSSSIIKSTDNGESWSQIKVALDKGYQVNWFEIKDSLMFLKISSQEWISSADEFKTWQVLPTPKAINKHMSITPTRNLKLSLYKPDDKYISTDNGWTWIKNPLIEDVRCWARLSKDTIVAINGKRHFLILSGDGGETWEEIVPSFYGIEIIKEGPDNKLYVSTDWQGVFSSDDLGLSWEHLSDISTINGMAFPNENIIAVSTSIHGVFICDNKMNILRRASNHGLIDSSINNILATENGSLLVAANSKHVDLEKSQGGGIITGLKVEVFGGPQT
ncbi:MAG: hypothetical protein HND52_19530 [Ignavibacteriae bacterium]|nr:hypothetical protein [Ignavibacteriota bacterium]NOH00159.1 hypothetical protein [Ignavibacteriota bacterium]